MDRLFLFIAKKLEGKGQPEGDNNQTIYGITKKYYPQQYALLLANQNDSTIIKVYRELFNKSPAKDIYSFVMQAFVFDFWFNSPVASKEALQKTSNAMNTLNVKGYFIPAMYYNALRIQHYLSNSHKNWRCGLVNRVVKLQKFVLQTYV